MYLYKMCLSLIFVEVCLFFCEIIGDFEYHSISEMEHLIIA